MCLGEVGRVARIGADGQADVRTGDRTRQVSLLTLDALDPPLAVGDWVVIHSGFALARLTPEEAGEAALLRRTNLTRTTQEAT